MFKLALRTLRFRKGGFIASFIALFLGAMIVTACGSLMETGIRGEAASNRFTQAPLLITGNQGYPEQVKIGQATSAAARQLPEVTSVIPVFTLPATVDEQVVNAQNWDSAALGPYRLATGRAPQTDAEIVLDAHSLAAKVKLGDHVSIGIQGQPRTATVVGITKDTTIDQPTIFFADTAFATFDNALPSTLAVIPKSQTDIAALQAKITTLLADTPLVVLIGNERGRAEFPSVVESAQTLIVISAVFGGLATTVAVFIIASTLGLSVQQRQREIALLRAIGGLPSQIRRLLVLETLLVAIVATGAALLPGVELGNWLLRQFATNDVVSPSILFSSHWIPPLIAVGVSLLTAVGAALIAAHGANRIKPIEALSQASNKKRWLSVARLAFALLCLGGGVALSLVTALVMSGPVAASTAGPTVMLWAAGFALLAPDITKLIGFLLLPLLRLCTGSMGYIATLNIRARSVQVASAIVPVLLVVGLSTAFLYIQTTQTSVARRQYTQSLLADATVTSSNGGLPASLATSISQSDTVSAVTPFVTSAGYLTFSSDEEFETDESLPFLGVDQTVEATIALQTVKGSLTALKNKTIALPQHYADSHNLVVGSRVTIKFGDSTPDTVTVVALYTATTPMEYVLFPAETLATHTTAGSVTQLLVKAAPGVTSQSLTRTLSARLANQPELTIAPRSQLENNFAATEQTGAWVNYLLVGMIVAYSVISLINSLLVSINDRRHEFALQRLVGATRAQIARMISIEALFIALAGAVLGTIVAAAALVPFCIALKDSPFPEGPPEMYLLIIGASTLLTFIASLIPTLLLLRTKPIEAAARRE